MWLVVVLAVTVGSHRSVKIFYSVSHTGVLLDPSVYVPSTVYTNLELGPFGKELTNRLGGTH